MSARIRIRTLGLLSCLLLTHWAFSQTIRYVTTTGSTAAGSASSWATSTNNLQGAIDYVAATGGGQVWVAAGVYKPAGGSSFSMKNGVTIYGGFTVGQTDPAQRNVNPVAGNPSGSTLSGDMNGDDGPNFSNFSDNSNSVIRNSSGLTASAVLDGFIITGGNSNFGGGGVYNDGAGTGNFCNPTFRNCSFINNRAKFFGGAVGNWAQNGTASPQFTNCSFQGNLVTDLYGGAICNYGEGGNSNPVLTNCNFQNNRAPFGGAIYNFGRSYGNANPTITNCYFQNNTADYNGGAILTDGSSGGTSSPVLTNCSFQGNTGFGRAIFSTYANPRIANSVIWGNGSIQADGTGGISASYCLFDATSFISGPGNLTTAISPFSSTASAVLAPCSQAINAGSNTVYAAVNGPATDLTGNSRIFSANGVVDMGAVEYQSQSNVPLVVIRQPVSGSVVCSGTTVLTDVSVTGSAPAYQWYRNGAPILGNVSAGSSSLTLPDVSTATAGSYSVVISGECPSITSTDFNLTVNATPSLTITTTPSTILTCANPRLTLTAISSVTALRWSTGETTAAISVSQTGTYSVIATGAGNCTATTNSANISVDKTSPSVSISATGTTLTCTQPQLTLTATSSTTGLLWSTGETTTTIAVSTTGVYSVTATGSNGCTAVSNGLTISQNNTSPTVSISATGTTLTCTQPQLTLTATSSTTGLLWSTGETATTIAVSTTGVYSVTATGTNGCTAVSNGLTISRDNASPTVSISAISNQLTCAQPTLTLTATASTTALRWSTGQTTNTISVSQTGAYSVTATGTNGCSAVSNNLFVTENFSLPPFTVSSATVCPGQSVNLTASGCSGLVLWPNGATGSMITLTAGNSTSLLTATCTVGSCSTTASGQIAIGGIQPPPAQILSFTADESACPVRLTGRGVATSFTMAGPKDYVFSTVYREGATHEAIGLNVKQAGTYTLMATFTNSCGTSAPVTRTVTVSRNCP